MGRKTVRITVAGRVQGVGFRWFTQAEAERLGLSGWVRNRRDGSVEAEVVGPPERIDEFAGRLAVGPSSSNVTDVSVQPLPDADEIEAGFGIRRTA